MLRLFKVVSAFPFVIVIATLNISNAHYIFRSVAFIRLMNFLIYLIPFIFGEYTVVLFYPNGIYLWLVDVDPLFAICFLLVIFYGLG